jgi:hypothetical protein
MKETTCRKHRNEISDASSNRSTHEEGTV